MSSQRMVKITAEYYPEDNHVYVNNSDNPYPDHINVETFAEPDVRRRIYVPNDRATGDTSDGYHTFNELYHHRAVLFWVICDAYPHLAWKSRVHHDGSMFDGMFIVGLDTPWGQATYHYDIDPYWNMFRCFEYDRAPEWDGHTPNDAIERILKLTEDGTEC